MQNQGCLAGEGVDGIYHIVIFLQVETDARLLIVDIFYGFNLCLRVDVQKP